MTKRYWGLAGAPHPGIPVKVQAVCGHVFLFKPAHRPEPGVLFSCLECRADTHVAFPPEKDVDGRPVVDEWRWLCHTGGACNRGERRYGQSRENASYAATRHSRRFPRHEVWLISPTGVVEARWGGQDYDAGEPLWVGGVAVWNTAQEEAPF